MWILPQLLLSPSHHLTISISQSHKPRTVSKTWTEAHLIDVMLRIDPARCWVGKFSNQIEIEFVTLSALDKKDTTLLVKKYVVLWQHFWMSNAPLLSQYWFLAWEHVTIENGKWKWNNAKQKCAFIALDQCFHFLLILRIWKSSDSECLCLKLD